MEKVTLFYLENPDITISMSIYFTEKEQLFFDGYDRGVVVEEKFGRDIYEYNFTVEPSEVEKLIQLLEVKEGDKLALLEELKKRFSVNEAYTLFGNFLNAHNIKYNRFTWF